MDTGDYELVVQRAFGAKRNRFNVRLNAKKIAADPLTAVNQRISAGVYLVIDAPLSGFTRTELKELVVGIADWAKAGTNANLLKVLGEET
jgi:hypothetical protein